MVFKIDISTMAEKLDVVIFGATGFTGKNAVKELNKIQKEKPMKWGIAGRSKEKLKEVLHYLEAKTGDNFSNVKIIIADINDEESLKKMTAQAKVIVNCCGPYKLYGEPVIKACIATGTHQVDVCGAGELKYLEKIQLEYNKAARDKGVYIISSCGLGSLPSDLGVVYLQQLFDGTVNEVETYLDVDSPPNVGSARLHYGTWATYVSGLNHTNELRPIRQNLYPVRLPAFTPKQKSRSYVHKNPVMDKWAIPYLGSDRSVVMRSQRHFYDHDKNRPVQVRTYVTLPSLLAVFVVGLFGLIIGILAKFSFGRHLLLTYPRIFSGGWVSREGPSDDMMEKSKFSVTIIGRGWAKGKTLVEGRDQHTEPTNKTTTIKVSGYNPGYGSTCIMLLMCGLTILKEADKMPDSGGVFPPGAAFAKTSLIQQLNKNGVTFEFVSSKKE